MVKQLVTSSIHHQPAELLADYYCFTTAVLIYYCRCKRRGRLPDTLLLLYYCFTTALLLLYCFTTAGASGAEDSRTHYYCFTTALLLLYYCFTALLLQVQAARKTPGHKVVVFFTTARLTQVGGLKLLVHEALSYWCMRP